MPQPNHLPDSIRQLTFCNAAPVRPDPDFARDINRLVSSILGKPVRNDGMSPLDKLSRITTNAQRPFAFLVSLSAGIIAFVAMVQQMTLFIGGWMAPYFREASRDFPTGFGAVFWIALVVCISSFVC